MMTGSLVMKIGFRTLNPGFEGRVPHFLDGIPDLMGKIQYILMKYIKKIAWRNHKSLMKSLNSISATYN